MIRGEIMRIEVMSIENIIEVAKLHNDLAYFIQSETKDAYFDFKILDEIGIGEHLKGFLDHPLRIIYVALYEEKVIGFIAGEMIDCYLPISRTKQVGYISGAFVKSEYRGKGVMKELENRISEYFKSSGIRYVELHFITNNNVARKTWEGLGYKTFREQARKQL